MRLFQFNKRIGVVGMYRSGKTVFMTSLINHLSRHDPSRFPLGKGNVNLSNFRSHGVQNGWQEFDYQRYRSLLHSQHLWPEKTLAGHQYNCSFSRSDWPNTSIGLSLVDLAGERLADMCMANASYEKWSDMVHGLMSHGLEYHNHVQDYLGLFDPDAEVLPEAELILHEYRRALARCCLAYLPMITPSSLLLDSSGGYVAERTVNDIAARRVVGLDSKRQFAPLPEPYRRANPELVRTFARHYKDYRREVVMPLAGWLLDCHELVVLLDLSSLLAGGLGAYHGAQLLVEELLDWVRPGRDFFGQLATLLIKPISGGRFRLPGVTRIAFVAAKADKVHSDDRHKLLSLLRDMVGPKIAGLQEDLKLKVDYFICASIKSTASRPNGVLEAVPAYSRGGQGKLSVFKPSNPPMRWPENWPAGEYNFPDVNAPDAGQAGSCALAYRAQQRGRVPFGR
jgi:predicted YcjX-like family ATPase